MIYLKSTPGPWDDASKYANDPKVRIFGGSHYIATVGNPDDSRDVTEANARLIAAAPELLDACNRTLEILDAWGPERRGDSLERLWERVTKAISKACHGCETVPPADQQWSKG